jgi:hypothetical protein
VLSAFSVSAVRGEDKFTYNFVVLRFEIAVFGAEIFDSATLACFVLGVVN